MRNKPILFSTEMVRAILEGRKTMTRRVIDLNGFGGHQIGEAGSPSNPLGMFYPGGIKRPRYQPGDILWVRERYRLTDFEHIDGDWNASVQFADGELGERLHNLSDDERIGWRPSIFMPKAAARIFLRVTNVRAERVQEITEADAIREGIDINAIHELACTPPEPMRCVFSELWDSINGKRAGGVYGWEKNPFVWVISFERIEKPEGWPEKEAAQ